MRKIIYSLLFLLLMTACTQNPDARQKNVETIPQGVSVRDSHPNMPVRTDYTNEQRADHLANLAAGIPNVHSATAVVLGNIAIVGIDVDKDLDKSKVGTIKYTVAEGLRHDPQGAGAIVVADPDVNTRLKKIRGDMNAGKPIQGIMNELSDVIGRLMPEVPSQENRTNPQEAPEEPKKQMNNQRDQELDKIQQDQSNEQK